MKRGSTTHPKMLELAERLDKPVYACVGIIECMYHWAAKYAIQGDIGKWSNGAIARGIGWDGDADVLVNALCASGWVDLADEPHRLVIHDIKDHADNAWRQNLAKAGLSFWDGSSNRRYKIEEKLQPNSNQTPTKLQPNSNKSPQTETETETKTETKTKRTTTPLPPKGGELTDDSFDQFWNSYPRKVGKGAARRAWLKLRPSAAQVDTILAAVKVQAQSHGWVKENGRYIPNPATWLSQERWDDDVGPVKSENDANYIPPDDGLFSY